MKFVVDAQLPRRLARELHAAGHDAVHTLDFPAANHTSDAEISRLAAEQDRIVVTKDADFVSSFLLFRRPPRLLLVSTGNITNAELAALFAAGLAQMEEAFTSADFVELTRSTLIVHV